LGVCIATETVAARQFFDIVSLLGYNGYMEIKDKIDLLVKRAELIYKKLFIFLAIAGGSWIYGLKDTEGTILRIFVLIIFALSVVGIILNLLKFGEIQKELKEFCDD
jgi:hypothetical protein